MLGAIPGQKELKDLGLVAEWAIGCVKVGCENAWLKGSHEVTHPVLETFHTGTE